MQPDARPGFPSKPRYFDFLRFPRSVSLSAFPFDSLRPTRLRVVAAALDRLPKNFVVFHDLNTARGNFDHLVIGPTGIFAVETKNFRGTISAEGEGELMQDGAPSSQPYVRQLICRIMAVREQVVALTGREVFIQGVMVFPKARVDASFGTTRNVHCLRDGQLCDYIENDKFGRRLTAEKIDLFTRAFQGIAGMGADFRNALKL